MRMRASSIIDVWSLFTNVLLFSLLDQDILLPPKEFPDLKAGDVVEIYHPEDDLK